MNSRQSRQNANVDAQCLKNQDFVYNAKTFVQTDIACDYTGLARGINKAEDKKFIALYMMLFPKICTNSISCFKLPCHNIVLFTFNNGLCWSTSCIIACPLSNMQFWKLSFQKDNPL